MNKDDNRTKLSIYLIGKQKNLYGVKP